MYALNNYGSMRLKVEMFNFERASQTNEAVYSGWRDVLEGNNAHEWNKFTTHFAEDFQLAILRAVTITGIHSDWWSYVFQRMSEGHAPFLNFPQLYMQDLLTANWRSFAEKLASEIWYPDRYFPCVYPEWLFPYGYTQRQYLTDLAVYWDNIYEDYFAPWEITPMGHDSPEIARLKKLGQQARAEIDQVARHSKHHLKR